MPVGLTPPERSTHLLVVGDDPTLEAEFATALDALPNYRIVTHHARQPSKALEIARARQPRLVVMDMGRDIRQVTALARKLHADVPGVLIAGLLPEDRPGTTEPPSTLLIEAIRARVQDFLRRPLSSSELRQLLDRLAPTDVVRRGRTGGTVAAFISNKGGVGKSTLSVNTACLLASAHPDRVLLIDASLQLGVCAMLLDLQPTTSLVDAIRQKDRLDDTLLTQLSIRHPSGLRLLAAPADAVEAAEVTDDGIARVLNRARHAFEFVIVDTFPMLDETVMAVLDVADLGFVVFQGTIPTVVGTSKLLPVLEAIGFGAARQRLVLNHGHRHFSGALSAGDIESRLGRPIDHDVPYDKRVLASMNTGEPYALKASLRYGFGRRLAGIADEIAASMAGPGGRTAADEAAGLESPGTHSDVLR